MAIADKYFSIEYEYGARGWEKGDCLNLPQLFYEEEFGISIDIQQYSYEEDWYAGDENLIVDNIEDNGFVKFVGPAFELGDIIIFNWRNKPSHLGIYLEGGFFIHTGLHGTGVSSILTNTWGRRVHSQWRHKDVSKTR